MTIQPGEIWIADIRFTDGSASKKRPALILWLDRQDAVVAAVTSSGARTFADVPLLDWQAEGLRVASIVRLSRLDCLEQSLLLHRVGVLSISDAQRVKNVWNSHIKPQF